jgi:hypothetical protein
MRDLKALCDVLNVSLGEFLRFGLIIAIGDNRYAICLNSEVPTRINELVQVVEDAVPESAKRAAGNTRGTERIGKLIEEASRTGKGVKLEGTSPFKDDSKKPKDKPPK